ncbi:IS66 family transposase, partial [Alkalispirochaeta sphaeroplastigenens]|uniref:IS66 family transposase n=1 Tax=Alkalispirochaeta sphaeroplastigenens TaxID=1187066 RepID=UPI0015E1B445
MGVRIFDKPSCQTVRFPGLIINTKKSYLWLLRGGPPEAPVVLYHYEQTRGADYLRAFLQGYHGYLQRDGYKVYQTLE